jgi:hypothetical protein
MAHRSGLDDGKAMKDLINGKMVMNSYATLTFFAN